MTSFRVRPKFRHISHSSPKEIVERMNKHLEQKHDVIEGKVFQTHGLFRIVPEHQHFWSPQLNVSFEEVPEGTIIRGMYGPHPTVWAVFLFGYALLGLAFFFISIVGMVKKTLSLESNILWFLPFILGGIVILWFVAQTGQKVGVEQTFQLHHFFEDSLDEQVHIS